MISKRAPLALISLVAGLLMLGMGYAHAAPKSELWKIWTAHDPASTAQVDHSAWDGFLKTYVKDNPTGLNRVDYGGVSEIDRSALAAYLEALSTMPVANLNRGEQQAFWINLYNALTVKVILDHYPVETIRDIDITSGLFADGPWGKKLIEVAGTPVSLDDIEHRILRPIWQDNRVHYAVNCASVGCPDLINRAYVAGDMDAVLTQNAKAYINSDRGLRLDGGTIIVSSIYDWFQADFGDSEQGVLQHLRMYAEGARKAALEKADDIDDYDYDWTLNGAQR